MRIIDIHKFITPAQRQAINLLASYGRATGIGIHLFGGFVRDLALGRVLAGVREQEEMRVVLLNTKHAVVDQQVVYKGTVNSAAVRSAELLRPAVAAGAPAIIVVHNHPSGDPEPSPEDRVTTWKLVEAGRTLDIAVLDHIVIDTPDRWVSMKEQSLCSFGGIVN